MTSLQFTQAQGLGYTRGMYKVPLSIQTYDSHKSTWHGFSLIPRPLSSSHMAYIGAYDLVAYALHQLYGYVRLVGSYQIATK